MKIVRYLAALFGIVSLTQSVFPDVVPGVAIDLERQVVIATLTSSDSAGAPYWPRAEVRVGVVAGVYIFAIEPASFDVELGPFTPVAKESRVQLLPVPLEMLASGERIVTECPVRGYLDDLQEILGSPIAPGTLVRFEQLVFQDQYLSLDRATVSGTEWFRVVAGRLEPSERPKVDVTIDRWKQRRAVRSPIKAAEPGATDNPDDAQRLREDH